MKSELRHLLDKLKAERPGFQQLAISHNGRAMAIYNGAPIHFDSLDAIEAWTYRPAPSAPTEHDQCQCAQCVKLRATSPSPSVESVKSVVKENLPTQGLLQVPAP